MLVKDVNMINEQDRNQIITKFMQTPGVQNALALRQCTFRPEDAFQIQEHFETAQYDIVMRPEARTLWFQTWCKENNANGQIICQTDKAEVVADRFIVIAKAQVYINETLVASDVGSRVVALTDANGMDSAIQMAASYAKGRALSNAGFGACCSMYDIPMPSGQNFQGGNDPQIQLPFNMPGSVPNGNQAVGGNTGSVGQGTVPPMPNGNRDAVPQNPAQAGYGPAINQGCYPNQGVVPGQGGQQQDLIARAKAMVWTVNGANKGKTLGDILMTDPTKILWAAQKARDPSLKEAANLLLPEANKICGM